MRGVAAVARNRPSADIRCTNCKDKKVKEKYVTFCPGCRQLRAESILLDCPNCGYGFADLSSAQAWTTIAEALDQFKVNYKRLAILEAVETLDPRPSTHLVNDLMSEISPSEELVRIGRCEFVDNRRWNTFVLLTSEKFVWTMSGSERHAVPISQIQELSARAGQSGEVVLTLTNGNRVVFSGFIGEMGMSRNGLPLEPRETPQPIS